MKYQVPGTYSYLVPEKCVPRRQMWAPRCGNLELKTERFLSRSCLVWRAHPPPTGYVHFFTVIMLLIFNTRCLHIVRVKTDTVRNLGDRGHSLSSCKSGGFGRRQRVLARRGIHFAKAGISAKRAPIPPRSRFRLLLSLLSKGEEGKSSFKSMPVRR